MEQYNVWANGCINRRIMSNEDIIEKIVTTDQYIIISSNKQTCIFIKNNNDFIHEITESNNTLFTTYFFEDTNKPIYIDALKAINKSLEDVIVYPFLDTNICVLLEYDLTNGFKFEHIDTMFEVKTIIHVKPKIESNLRVLPMS